MTQAAPKTIASGAATNSFDERFLDAKLEAVEARTETKFAQLIGKMDGFTIALGSVAKDVGQLKVEIAAVDAHARNAKSTIIIAIIGSVIGIISLTYAAVAIYVSAMGTTASAYQSGMAAAEAHKK
ncbi:hypothetical protein D3Y57_19070 [Sphingomonas paeninsulae]|uniref:Uncharacterized protein n=1 Tax=Sphingomonas paeninsulae TaxID=2319844 RepID=A0A494TDM4_SPHPE|nr:hypothetical protein [Sphingomonas paeninsulae]AYJ87639.1 hypothetical protein D3Y57_19070 [Sphingomonas paeninsulae]